MNKNSIAIIATALLITACGQTTRPPESTINPRDTVQVPEGLTGADSIAYIDDAVMKSPFTADGLLSLAEVHLLEGWLLGLEDGQKKDISPSDAATISLANRFLHMYEKAEKDGNPNDLLEWVKATNTLLDQFCKQVPSVNRAVALDEMPSVAAKFSSETQMELNFQSSIDAVVENYRTIEEYRQWLSSVPSNLKALAQKEYETWYAFNKAHFAFWQDVAYSQEWYSMKPMEINGYDEMLMRERRNELMMERGIVMQGKRYIQKGKTVTTKQWEGWIAEHSTPLHADMLKEMGQEDQLPSDSLVAARTSTLKDTFSQWLAARQAFAEALSEEQGTSYDNLTADIHRRYVRKVED